MINQSKEEKLYARSIIDFRNNIDSNSDIELDLDFLDSDYESTSANYDKKTFLKITGEKEYLDKNTNPILLKFISDQFSDDETEKYQKYKLSLESDKLAEITKNLSDTEISDEKLEKPCPPNKIRNPKTGRCISQKVEKQKKDKDKKEKKECPPGKIRNPETGRCIDEKKLSKKKEITKVPETQVIVKENIQENDTRPNISSLLENIPLRYFNKNTFSVMLAKNYTPDIDPTGYYLSEKLDGIRAVYHNGEFISRTNKPFNAPEWFTKHYPTNIVFDGELFTKRKDFKGVMSTVTKKIPIDSEWENVVYMVFDLPTIKLPFEQRYELLRKIVDEINILGNMRINYVNQHKIKNRKELDEMHKELTLKGAEGTMLRKPKSSYENTRSSSLLKYKDFIDDEAVVEGFEFGDGRNSNRMGNLIVKWLHPGEKDTEGNTKTTDNFNVGSGFDDDQRINYKTLFPKGTVIKIKYGELQSSGKPRFPTYLATIPTKFAH